MNLRSLLFFPAIAVGVAGYLWLTKQDPAEEGQPPAESATVVRVQSVVYSLATPAASGFGRVMAEDSWSGIAQVQGRATFVLETLDVGRVIEAGREIVRIDPRDYEIALARATASQSSAAAALAELDATEQNTNATMSLERRIEGIRRAELARQQELLSRGSGTQAKVDAAVRDLLAQEKVLLGLENSLRLLPAQRASLQATIDTRVVEIEEAERAVANTKIKTPMTGRVTAKTVTDGQFVRVGDTLVTIEATAASEVVAEFQTRVLGNFFSVLVGQQPVDPFVAMSTSDAFDIVRQFDLKADVRLKSGEDVFSWPAELVRFDGSADPTTGAVGLVVRVKNPNLPNPKRRQPPLINGSFVEVRLSAPEPVRALRIPRASIHTDDAVEFVYVVDEKSRLARREIETAAVQDDTITVVSGLAEGDRLVLSDPRPAVIGMLLEPVEAKLAPGQ